MKIFKVIFEGMYPIPSGLVIAAKDKVEALKIATKTIKHTHPRKVIEIDISISKVIFYESGNY